MATAVVQQRVAAHVTCGHAGRLKEESERSTISILSDDHDVTIEERPAKRLRCEAAPLHQTTASVVARDHFIFENRSSVSAEYDIKGPLGNGSFSSVHRAVHKRTGIERAVKKITKARTNKEQFTAEVRALISLDHPHIVKVLEYFEDKSDYYVVMELCTGKDLFDFVDDYIKHSPNGGLAERDAATITRQCLKAMIGCHTKGFIHRDLKLENFVLVGEDHTVKLIDFGLARRLLDNAKKDCSEGVAGTLPYLAPELMCKQKYGRPVDVWSLGVVLFMMLTGEPLLTAGKEAKQLKDKRFVTKRLETCEAIKRQSPALRDLLARMLAWDQDARITAEGALEHEVIRSHWCQEVRGYFNWSFDRTLPDKMQRFAEVPLLRKTGLLCLVHLASASHLPSALYMQLTSAMHIFRSMDSFGMGKVSFEKLRACLSDEGIPVPKDFEAICRKCQQGTAAGHRSSGYIDYGVLVACILLDCHWPDYLLRETFNILDRSRNGVIEVQDLVMLSHADTPDRWAEIIREVDPDDVGYVNYDHFTQVMHVDPVASATLSIVAKPVGQQRQRAGLRMG